MTPFERYTAVCEGRLPDRVPVSPFIMSFAARVAGVRYEDYCRSGEVMARAQIECVRRFGYEGVNVTSDAVREAETLGVEVYWPEDDVPATGGDTFIRSEDDLKRLHLPDPLGANRMHEQIKALQILNHELRDEGQICFGWVEAPFEEAAILRDINLFMTDLYVRPDFAKELIRFALDMETAFGLAQIEAGARFIGVGDPIGTLVSPSHFLEFNFLYVSQMLNTFRKRGAIVLYHVCGSTQALLPCFAELNANIIQLDSLVDLAEARSVLPERMVIMGNLDPVGDMLFGTPDKVIETSKTCIQKAGVNGRFILSPGCEVPRDTPPANLEALISCADDFGSYPIGP
jgi:uroporphyrinogen decarboxylase